MKTTAAVLLRRASFYVQEKKNTDAKKSLQLTSRPDNLVI